MVKRNLAAENYLAARGLLRNLGARFPEFKESTLVPYENQLQQQAQALLTEAQAAQTAGKLREAHESVRRALNMWPTLAGGRELALAIHQQYPVVVVAVHRPGAGRWPPRLDDWSSVRTARLVGRPIVERSASGEYQSPLGELTRGEDSSRLLLRLLPDLKWSDPARRLTAPDVARSLLAQADPNSSVYDATWAIQLAAAVAQGRDEVEVTLTRPQPLMEAWLCRPLILGADQPCGPFALNSHTPESARFVREAGYFAAGAQQPGEILERVYIDAASALRALRRGEIDVVDRLSPWDIANFTAASDVTVKPYAVPTVHVLMPNPSRPLVNHRAMRRAILYGIDRQSILERGLLAGSTVPGCEVVSGPFPKGNAGDEFAYAYNPKVEIRPYEPGTALVLARLARQEVASTDGSSVGTAPELVLLHPPGPVARAACQSLARQVGLIGLSINLREATADPAALADYDLRYAELTIREPAVDVWRLLGPRGAAGA
jgi:hypothetical protein